ncbi:hypothetical protein BH11MYX1_BH11MYX1_46990 [soil metagenome]
MAAFTWRSLLCVSALCCACKPAHLAATPVGAKGPSPRPGWGARTALAIDLHATRPLVDFPVAIRLTPDRFDFKRIAVDGHDLRFTDDAGVDLTYEIEVITTRGAVIWLRMPRLEVGAPAKVTMYFDNPAAPYLDATESRQVWRAGFAAVIHGVEEGGDSSPHQATTGVVGTNPAEGVFGAALYFATKQLDAVSVKTEPLDGDRSLCVWIRPDAVEGKARIAGATGFALERDGAGLRCGDATAPNTLAAGGWRYACCVHHAGRDALFVDGIAAGTPGKAKDTAPDTAFEAGGAHTDKPAKRFAGILDELRISHLARDPAWLAAEVAERGDVVAVGAIEDL